MIPRIYSKQVRRALSRYPAAALLGPRQCGKTTLARQFKGVYLDMEAEGSATRLDSEWDALVSGRPLVILDEVHCTPHVFPRLRGAIDNDRQRRGRFLLLGSVSPALMTNVSESLAGRLGMVRMGPLALPELRVRQMDSLWLYGGYPDGGILQPEMFPRWQQTYLDMLTMRDLPAWGLPAKPPQSRRLAHMLAALHAQPLNASQLGASLGLDYKTVQTYCDYLEGAYLIRRLAPYFANVKKRLVKTPRVYWRDSGLLHALMGVSDMEHLYHQPWVGASWEGFVLEQTLAVLAAHDKYALAYYFRTSDGHELDLVLDWGDRRWAVEIKLTSAPSMDTVARMNKAADMIDAERRILVCRIARKIENDTTLVTNLSGWLRTLAQ